jgi:hypothetical protein
LWIHNCRWGQPVIRNHILFSFFQVQHKNALYKGTFDAFHKILKYEGVKGLYRGFWISCFQVSWIQDKYINL